GSTDVLTPDTVLPENDQVDVHNILVHPIEEHEQEIGTVLYPEEDLVEYIVTFPADAGLPPLYLVFNKPKVKPLEVGTYGELAPKSKKDGMDIDHIPSQAALRRATESALQGQALTKEEERTLINTAAIAIPQEVHRKCSETYGGRNQADKQKIDAMDIKSAVDSNFDAIKECLKNEGYSDEDLEKARTQLHEINIKNGWY
ncbi:S-type pyocin domain-containing protein, partial [Vibrio sp. M250220]|uniref:S-type pyocin domain-containing protein n=1 Tax=Vibrio sp. M250220 TaxID=3020894 RepID=UPI002F40E13C